VPDEPLDEMVSEAEALEDAGAVLLNFTNAVWFRTIVAGMSRLVLDRDTAPGPSRKTFLRYMFRRSSCPDKTGRPRRLRARWLQECLSGTEYWGVPVADNAPLRVMEFLGFD